jgi:hypothetical protein
MVQTMIERRDFLRTLAATGVTYSIATRATAETIQATSTSDRTYWLNVLTRLADPILTNLAQQRLKERMPVEAAPGMEVDRREYAHLEALGRLLAGIAPWLELDSAPSEEGQLREKYCVLSRRALDAATDPKSRDYMNFTKGGQPLVERCLSGPGDICAHLKKLWTKLDVRTQSNVITALRATRVIKPGFNNWLMFSAMIEAALASLGEQWDQMRVDYAVRQHEQWYKGDGTYGDGPDFHWDYYNSFVIQPMLIDVLGMVAKQGNAWNEFLSKGGGEGASLRCNTRAIDLAGRNLPAVGRSITYRFGAFQLLGQLALMRQLPTELNAVTSEICFDCSYPSHDRSTRDVRQRRLADNRVLRASTEPGREIHFNRQPLPLRRWSTAIGLPVSDDFWVGPQNGLDSQEVVVRQRHACGSRTLMPGVTFILLKVANDDERTFHL